MALRPRPEDAPRPIEAAERPALPTGELPSGKPQELVVIGPNGAKIQMVIMPKHDYDVLIEAARDNIEDLADAEEAIEILRRIQSGKEGTLPAEVVDRLGRENRIKVLREHRGMTQAALGEAVGSSSVYISQLERDVRKPSLDLLQRIAQVLHVPIDLVAPSARPT
jgi:DNA-binding XRE family transcriptional regulator